MKIIQAQNYTEASEIIKSELSEIIKPSKRFLLALTGGRFGNFINSEIINKYLNYKHLFVFNTDERISSIKNHQNKSMIENINFYKNRSFKSFLFQHHDADESIKKMGQCL